MTDAAARPLRADARRNRDRLVEVAVRALAQSGPEVTLDSIAREAGVGIGTLYRHFPTREALVEAAYRGEVARLCDSVDDLLRTLPADVALRSWMWHFVEFLTAKHGMAEALRAVIATGVSLFPESRASLLAAVTALLAAGAADAGLRDDVDPFDVMTALSGISLAAGGPEQRDRAGRLLDLLLDGLRYHA